MVGSGLAGFTAYQTLRRGGLEPAEIAVFGDDADPVATWRLRAAAIRQREMRSESDGHCLPKTFPGLALRSVVRRRSLAPLVATVADRYHPTVDEFLEHVERLRERSRWDESVRLGRVASVDAADGGFELRGGDGGALGTFRHVLVATGHPGLNVPEELRGDPRTVHSYEPHDYASTVTVVGAGLAAATEWLNALEAGAEVVSVRRREPVRRPLNVPRPYLSRRGLAGFHRLAPRERAARLQRAARAVVPARAALRRAARARRRRGPLPRRELRERHRAGDRRDRLPARLAARPAAPPPRRRARARDRGATGSCSTRTRRCRRSPTRRGRSRSPGAPAQWAFPAADTLAGAKYAGHRFLGRIAACRTR